MSQVGASTSGIDLRDRSPGLGWVAVGLAVGAAVLGARLIAPLVPVQVDLYIVQPALWLAPAALALWLFGGDRRGALWPDGLALTALSIGLIQVTLSVAAGFALGFGRSPFPHDPLSLVKNAWYVGALLIGREVARWYLVTALRRHGELIAFGATTVLLTLATIPLHALSQLGQSDTAFDFAGRVLLPAAAGSLLATYLALSGGPLASAAYLGVLGAFEWFAPVLPDLPWMMTALIGVIVPIGGLVVIQPADEDGTEEESGLSLFWVGAVAAILVIFWFNTGVFGVRPVLVQGISMEPKFHTGDVVIVRPVDPEDLKVGDIIQFRDGNHDVLHRIIEIRQEVAGLVFITQGDNNDAPDSPVPAENVRGRLALHIPKAGLPGIYLKRLVTAVVR
ncbi:signal peptidase I [Sphaerobacter sp.]|mgnify:CR=1 FL=1|uniref:signal peptidase I n=1 Tax=Sphaerobacter sp. TaxID=2099654 RepID=UPI001D5C526A|nr:signal peptidase I [Sphaerobacter sp.]MBX5446463.1 signal peptidase I [Sphaerobacter sp.]